MILLKSTSTVPTRPLPTPMRMDSLTLKRSSWASIPSTRQAFLLPLSRNWMIPTRCSTFLAFCRPGTTATSAVARSIRWTRPLPSRGSSLQSSRDSVRCSSKPVAAGQASPWFTRLPAPWFSVPLAVISTRPVSTNGVGGSPRCDSSFPKLSFPSMTEVSLPEKRLR